MQIKYMASVPAWGSVIKENLVSKEQVTVYGKWLAERYKDQPNIIWLNGGDIKGNLKQKVWKALGNALIVVTIREMMKITIGEKIIGAM